MTSLTQSVGTVISAHLTDEAASLKLVKSEQFLFLLRLNLLFFDHLAIPIIGILNNPHFASLISEDRESASQLFKSDETGFIRPIVFSYGSDNKTRTPQEIVKIILPRRKRIYLSEKALNENANFISDVKPMTFCTADLSFRLKYHSDLLEIVALINKEGLQAWQSNAPLLPSHSLHNLHDWLHSIDANTCNCTDAFEMIDRNTILNEVQKQQAKIVAAATWMHSIRGSLIGSLSVPPEYLPLVGLFRKLGLSSDTITLKNVEATEFPISVPFEKILQLPLRAFLELRDLNSFRNIRNFLSQYRKSSKSVNEEELKQNIDQCCEELLDFERRGRDRLSKENFSACNQVIKEVRKKEDVGHLKIWRDRATGLCVFLGILSPLDPLCPILASFSGGGAYLLDRHIEKMERALSTSLSPEAKNDIVYRVVNGTTDQT